MRQDKQRRYLRFLGSRPDSDVEDEIAFHLEMRAKEFMARGMEPTAAREEARRRFGDRARVEAEMRRMERSGEVCVGTSALKKVAPLARYRTILGGCILSSACTPPP